MNKWIHKILFNKNQELIMKKLIQIDLMISNQTMNQTTLKETQNKIRTKIIHRNKTEKKKKMNTNLRINKKIKIIYINKWNKIINKNK